MKLLIKKVSSSVAIWVVLVLALTGSGVFMSMHDGHHMQTCPFGESMQKGCGSLALLHATHWSVFFNFFLAAIFFLIVGTALYKIVSSTLFLIEKERKRHIVQVRREYPVPAITQLFSIGILNPKLP